MQPAQVEIGSDVYRTTTVQGPYPAFDSATGAIGRAFTIFRKCLPTLAKVALPGLLPSALIAACAEVMATDVGAHAALRSLSTVSSALVSTWMLGVTLHVAHAQVEGRKVVVAEATRSGFDLFGRMFSVGFVTGMLMMLGSLLLLVPGFYWSGKYSLVYPVVYFERTRRAGDTMARSAELTRDVAWRAAWTQLLTLVLCFVFICALSAFSVAVPTGPGGFAVAAVIDFVTSLTFAAFTILQMVMYLGTSGYVPEPADDAALPRP